MNLSVYSHTVGVYVLWNMFLKKLDKNWVPVTSFVYHGGRNLIKLMVELNPKCIYQFTIFHHDFHPLCLPMVLRWLVLASLASLWMPRGHCKRGHGLGSWNMGTG